MYTDLEGLGIPRRKGSGIGGLQVVGQVMMTMINDYNDDDDDNDRG